MSAMERAMPGDAFQVKDCALITRMAGISSVMNLRELHERLTVCPLESLYHHFCETQIRPSFDDPEFRNDFAVWASRSLGDRVLAERFGILNPYTFNNLEELRDRLVEIVAERASELPNSVWHPASEEFRFMQAATVIFETGVELMTLAELQQAIPAMSQSSVYYHFVEARRRTAGGLDDFSSWLAGLAEETTNFVRGLNGIDFYFLNLRELKRELVGLCRLEEVG
ncbi:MAG: hypothetical protein GXP51_12910 [Deltaproteobacteria bacterium]|nr:hypothetical protein [Deltaproteobacteria bacterium]